LPALNNNISGFERIIISSNPSLDMTTSHSNKPRAFSLLCPSRGRPHFAKRLLDSLKSTTFHRERIELLFYLDADDPLIEGYRAMIDAENGAAKSLGRLEVLVGESKSISQSWNDLAAGAHGGVMMMANDDQVYIHSGWDLRLDEEIDRFPDEIYCLWFNDGINAGNHCAFPIISRLWYETLKYFTPGIFEFIANDTWIMDVANRAGRLHYIDDVTVEHRHFTAGKAEFDETYQRHRSGVNKDRIARDLDLFERTSEIRELDAKRLRTLITI
jgi:hypothetical protein